MSSPFKSPSEIQSGVNVADLEGALIVLRPTGPPAETETVRGKSMYTPAQALVVTPVTLEQKELAGEWLDLWIFPKVLQGMLRNAKGEPILGTLGHGVAQPGQNAPWVLVDPDPNQEAVAVTAYQAANAGTFAAPSGLNEATTADPMPRPPF